MDILRQHVLCTTQQAELQYILHVGGAAGTFGGYTPPTCSMYYTTGGAAPLTCFMYNTTGGAASLTCYMYYTFGGYTPPTCSMCYTTGGAAVHITCWWSSSYIWWIYSANIFYVLHNRRSCSVNMLYVQYNRRSCFVNMLYVLYNWWIYSANIFYVLHNRRSCSTYYMLVEQLLHLVDILRQHVLCTTQQAELLR